VRTGQPTEGRRDVVAERQREREDGTGDDARKREREDHASQRAAPLGAEVHRDGLDYEWGNPLEEEPRRTGRIMNGSQMYENTIQVAVFV